MKKYKIPIIIFSTIVLFVVSIQFFIFLYSNHDDAAPPSYNSIAEFEKETDIDTYQFYDIDEFMNNDQKVLLEDSQKNKSVTDYSKNKKTSYNIETKKDGIFYNYAVYLDSLFQESISNTRKDTISQGTLYQYYYKDDSGTHYVGYFVKSELYYSVTFGNNILDTNIVEEKFVDYIKLVEDIN